MIHEPNHAELEDRKLEQRWGKSKAIAKAQ